MNKVDGKKIVLTKVSNCLKGEYEIMKNITDKNQLLEEADTIYKLMMIINNFDDLEPTLENYFKEKRNKEKWGNER